MANYKYRNKTERKKALTQANNKYKKTHQTAYTIRFHNVNDQDVINKLKTVPNVTDYLRGLIRKDL